MRSGRARASARHRVDPEAWWAALRAAVSEAGGNDDVAAIAEGGQQHGMVWLDEDGPSYAPPCCGTTPAPRSAAADLGEGRLVTATAGAAAWAEAVGSVPVASFTVAGLRCRRPHAPATSLGAPFPPRLGSPVPFASARGQAPMGLSVDPGHPF